MGQKILVPPQPCPKPPAVFLSLPCPLVISLIPFLFLLQGRVPAGVRERVISKQLRVGHIYLSLGAGPFFQPLSSPPNVPIARAPPSQLLSFLGVIIKRKKKKKASAQGWVSPGSWGLVPGSSLPAMPTSPWAQNKPKPSLYVDDALL